MTDQLDDKELFQAALSDEPIVEAPEPEKSDPVADGPARDEQGRFAPKVETVETELAKVEPVQEQPKTDEAHVPSWRLREVNEAREAAERRYQEAEARAVAFERQMAELRKQAEPKQEPVDFFADPEARIKQTLSPIEERMQAMQTNFNLRASKAEALAIHGKDAVKAMEDAIGAAMRERHPDMAALSVQMRNSDDPVGVAMQWYQRDRLLKETGGDLTTYRTKTLEDALKDPAFLAKAIEAAKAQASGQQPSQGRNIVQLPPSISRATSAASPHEEVGDMSDRSLWAIATK